MKKKNAFIFLIFELSTIPCRQVTDAHVSYSPLWWWWLALPRSQVGGVVETNRPDTKNAQYQACIKQGDFLLNRVQKLGRVVDA